MTEPTQKRKRGRPKRIPLVDPAIAEALCEWTAAGKPMSEFCRQPGMPKRRTINEWRQKDVDFAAEVARAKDAGFEEIADDCMTIADRSEDYKLMVETRLKLLACWDPRRYGNKAQVEHSGGVQIQVVTGVPDDGEAGE